MDRSIISCHERNILKVVVIVTIMYCTVLYCYHHVFQEVNVSTLIFIKNVENRLWQIFGLISIQIFGDFYEQFLAAKSMSMKIQYQQQLYNIHQSVFICLLVGPLSKPIQQHKINHSTSPPFTKYLILLLLSFPPFMASSN